MIGATVGAPPAAKLSKATSTELRQVNGSTPAHPSSGIGDLGAALSHTSGSSAINEPGMKKLAKRTIRFQPLHLTSSVSSTFSSGSSRAWYRSARRYSGSQSKIGGGVLVTEMMESQTKRLRDDL
eukprot:CAMPEP_0182822258 /NCGR_PEP_ID=MMETSP0006_2-20121128/14117_1 /TAXON_ID=97485 /ORGANISM="Prymnesium parvum, Strain Texoma1" /LENGTH=124 /DNA_ID=CAMNT_0024949089 /DNA_START=645 /DNA_END=1019 /DNA_ORIENTATION=-